MFTLTFTLRQHTPLIHFQHEQEGATLRATEVKPKLDRFILKEVSLASAELKGWLVGNEGKKALDYKMHISAEKAKEYLVASYIPKHKKAEYESSRTLFLSSAPYFADNELIKNGKLSEARRGMMYKNIQLTITSFHEDLLQLIRTKLPYLLVYENFGTRQSKGFGCFTVEKIDNVPQKYNNRSEFEAMILECETYKDTFSTSIRGDLEKVYKALDLEYKILKSGFGDDKSELQGYFSEEYAIEWEKTLIKRVLINGRGKPKSDDFSKNEKNKYIRALLGLAELYEFSQMKLKVKIMDEKGEIERFRSPITFKIFEEKGLYYLYMLAKQPDSIMFGRTFRFFLTDKEYITLSTPELTTGFDIYDFLAESVSKDWDYIE